MPDTIFHIENRRQGARVWDMTYSDAHNKVCQQLTRNNPAMSWARAAELATGMLTKADHKTGVPINRYGVEVTAA